MRHFAIVTFRPNESTAAALARVQPWLNAVQLPPNRRLVWGDVFSETSARVGLQSFLITGALIVTTGDVTDAAAVRITLADGTPEASVSLTLSPDGAERLRVATRDNVQRRIAIMLDGHVNAAPVVRAEISGGRATLSFGPGTFDKEFARAEAVAAALRIHR